MKLDENQNINIDLFNKASSWVKKYPGQYKLIIEECYKKLNRGHEKILLVDILSSLIWHKGLLITRSYAKPLTLYIESSEPGLKNKFYTEEEMERRKYFELFQFIKMNQFMNF